MADGINMVMLAGNVGSDPDYRVSQAGTEVLNFRIAVNESYKDRSGEFKEKTEWCSCVIFGKRAGSLSRILVKGSTVMVQGKLSTESYEKNGEKRYSTKVVVDKLVLGGRGNASVEDNGEAPPDHGAAPPAKRGQGKAQAAPADNGYNYNDDGIPF